MAFNHPYPLKIEDGDLQYQLMVYPDASVQDPGQTYQRRGSTWWPLRPMTTNDCLNASRACDGLVELIERLCDNLDWDAYARRCEREEQEENEAADAWQNREEADCESFRESI